jgi:hypothetical protein
MVLQHPMHPKRHLGGFAPATGAASAIRNFSESPRRAKIHPVAHRFSARSGNPVPQPQMLQRELLAFPSVPLRRCSLCIFKGMFCTSRKRTPSTRMPFFLCSFPMVSGYRPCANSIRNSTFLCTFPFLSKKRSGVQHAPASVPTLREVCSGNRKRTSTNRIHQFHEYVSDDVAASASYK